MTIHLQLINIIIIVIIEIQFLPHFLYVYRQVQPSGESLRIVWPSSGLELARPTLGYPRPAIVVTKPSNEPDTPTLPHGSPPGLPSVIHVHYD